MKLSLFPSYVFLSYEPTPWFHTCTDMLNLPGFVQAPDVLCNVWILLAQKQVQTPTTFKLFLYSIYTSRSTHGRKSSLYQLEVNVNYESVFMILSSHYVTSTKAVLFNWNEILRLKIMATGYTINKLIPFEWEHKSQFENFVFVSYTFLYT